MIVLMAKYFARPGMGDRVEEALRRMIPLARQEEGCALYKVARSTENRDVFLLYEIYKTEQALLAHRETPHYKSIVEQEILPLLEKRERETFELIESE